MKKNYFEFLEKIWNECKGSPLWYQLEIFIEKLSIKSHEIFINSKRRLYRDNKYAISFEIKRKKFILNPSKKCGMNA